MLIVDVHDAYNRTHDRSHARTCVPPHIHMHTHIHITLQHIPLSAQYHSDMHVTIATCTFTSLPRITHTHSLSSFLPISLTYTHTYHLHLHTHTHTHTRSLSLSCSHTHTHQHTHTHTHTSTQRKQRHLASGPDHLSGECISLCGGGLTATVTAGWYTGDLFPGL
jgi:hypothetical protein